MPRDDINWFINAGITNPRDQDRYRAYLDEVLQRGRLDAESVVGVAEKGTSGPGTLYVVGRDAVWRADRRRKMFQTWVEAERVCAIDGIRRVEAQRRGFKGRDVVLTASDEAGRSVMEVVWSLGGPDWVEPLIERQLQQLRSLLREAAATAR